MASIKPRKIQLKDGTDVILRAGLESDAQAILRAVSVYVDENDGQVWEPGEFKLTVEDEVKWIAGMLENAREILIVAEHQGQIVGNIDFHAGTRNRTRHVGEFGMGMLPEWRSRGLGAALLGALIDWAKQLGDIEKINLRVLATNQRAIGLYKKFGFTEEGRRSREYKFSDETYVDDIAMGLFLNR